MHNYLSGFANWHQSQAINGALPIGQNSPQKPNLGLYAEQINGTAFTMLRHENKHSWLYRINPSVKTGRFSPYLEVKTWQSSPFKITTTPNQLRFDKFNFLAQNKNFVTGMHTIAGHGCFNSLTGAAIHIYSFNQSMLQEFMVNNDGEMLLIPVIGELIVNTEMGTLDLKPLEIAVIPRGIKFQIQALNSSDCYGYVCENYGNLFKLPELGPIGSNGLANPRDFNIPQAKYANTKGSFKLINKFQGQFFISELTYNPLDVVAWHGNYYPYKYNLMHFNTIGSISFDHPDPSIFTVLTSPGGTPGMANIDFVIFPPRWLVMEHSFRPPWFHLNLMSEFMGLITGEYDAKPKGFVPGGASLHNRMSAHGPDSNATINAISKNLSPEYLANTMAFMLESSLVWQPTELALSSGALQLDYQDCWNDIPVLFK